ncbi:hypothetical protein EZY14_009355 [Kordia sp. TARA_039_SRF]|nr:hypothetical protein EZY14_009355 [Kordia sp. TARA_039_SRF]
MKTLNFILDGFGFLNFADFKASTFKILLSEKLSYLVLVGSSILKFLHEHLDITKKDLLITAIIGFVMTLFIISEFLTGLALSRKRGETFKSRLLGRMILKLGVYLMLLLSTGLLSLIKFPSVLGFEIDPFLIMFYFVLLAFVLQLLISNLENVSKLGLGKNTKLVKAINKKFNGWLDIDEPEN